MNSWAAYGFSKIVVDDHENKDEWRRTIQENRRPPPNISLFQQKNRRQVKQLQRVHNATLKRYYQEQIFNEMLNSMPVPYIQDVDSGFTESAASEHSITSLPSEQRLQYLRGLQQSTTDENVKYIQGLISNNGKVKRSRIRSAPPRQNIPTSLRRRHHSHNEELQRPQPRNIHQNTTTSASRFRLRPRSAITPKTIAYMNRGLDKEPLFTNIVRSCTVHPKPPTTARKATKCLGNPDKFRDEITAPLAWGDSDIDIHISRNNGYTQYADAQTSYRTPRHDQCNNIVPPCTPNTSKSMFDAQSCSTNEERVTYEHCISPPPLPDQHFYHSSGNDWISSDHLELSHPITTDSGLSSDDPGLSNKESSGILPNSSETSYLNPPQQSSQSNILSGQVYGREVLEVESSYQQQLLKRSKEEVYISQQDLIEVTNKEELVQVEDHTREEIKQEEEEEEEEEDNMPMPPPVTAVKVSLDQLKNLQLDDDDVVSVGEVVGGKIPLPLPIVRVSEPVVHQVVIIDPSEDFNQQNYQDKGETSGTSVDNISAGFTEEDDLYKKNDRSLNLSPTPMSSTPSTDDDGDDVIKIPVAEHDNDSAISSEKMQQEEDVAVLAGVDDKENIGLIITTPMKPESHKTDETHVPQIKDNDERKKEVLHQVKNIQRQSTKVTIKNADEPVNIDVEPAPLSTEAYYKYDETLKKQLQPPDLGDFVVPPPTECHSTASKKKKAKAKKKLGKKKLGKKKKKRKIVAVASKKEEEPLFTYDPNGKTALEMVEERLAAQIYDRTDYNSMVSIVQKFDEQCNKKMKNQPWLFGRMALSKQICRFSLPIDLRQLEGVTPSQYLDKHCEVCRRRVKMYTAAFDRQIQKRRGKDTQLNKSTINIKEMERAFQDVHANSLTVEQLQEIKQLVCIDNDQENQQNVQLLSCNLFCVVSAFAERLFYNQFVPEDGDDTENAVKHQIEKADFDNLEWRLQTVNVSPQLKTLLLSI